MNLTKQELLIIGGVQLTAGVFESIIIPNIGQKGFTLPNKTNIAITAGILTGTGIASGYLAEYMLEKLDIPESKKAKRAAVIAGSTFLVNCLQALLVENTINHGIKTEEWKTPSLAKFSKSLIVLSFTGLLSGIATEQLLLSSLTSEPKKVLEEKS